MLEKIECPQCGTKISVDEAIIQRAVDAKVKGKLSEEKDKIEEALRQEFKKNQSTLLKQLQEKLAYEEKKRRMAEQKELEFLKKQTELEDKIRRQDLEIARKIQDERRSIIEKTQKESEEKFQFLNDELRKQLEDTKKALQEAQRKAHQGSMQTQGEVLELSLEETLKTNFPYDVIEPVGKGVTGADIIQKVFSATGRECGKIVWESKQTKSWTEDWVQKLKDDGRNVEGNILVLVTEILPKKINNFSFYKGIWVTDFSSILGLTMALRNQLISNAKILAMQENKDDKKEIIYNYLCSQSFANKIQTMAENFIAMKALLEREKMNMQKIWALRETQINRLSENTMAMYGEIEGRVGKSLPEIKLLELESGLDKKTNTRQKSSDNKPKDTDQSSLFI